MIYSSNPVPHKNEFEQLLSVSKQELDDLASKNPNQILALGGVQFEPYLADILKNNSRGTPFENSIRITAAQDFPDIIVKNFYGIEVKTTNKNHWRTTGNSVLESRRDKDAERIYMFFGKLSDPIQFKFRPYEDCLAEVVVTHSPRYLIDMNLGLGETIFDKMEISYDVIRESENPIGPMVDYYRSTLKKGDKLWWINQADEGSQNVVLKYWGNLSKEKKQGLKNKAMVYFPELFGKGLNKFQNVTTWLVTKESVICPNVRDPFTAGGQEDYILNGKSYKDVPRSLINITSSFAQIRDLIIETSSEELSYYWEVKTTERTKVDHWKKLASQNLTQLNKISKKEIDQILSSL